MNKEIYILGVGRNTIVLIDLAETCGYQVKGLYHFNNSRTGEIVENIPIIDSTENLLKSDSLEGKNFAFSMGDNLIRHELFEKITEKKGNIPTLIHPTAVVSKYAKIGNGVIINALSVVQADAIISKNCYISSCACITHTSFIGSSCYLAFQSIVGAYVNIGDFTFVGQNSTIVSGKVNSIGNNVIIGAGSVVVKDVEPKVTVVGNPAKPLKK